MPNVLASNGPGKSGAESGRTKKPGTAAFICRSLALFGIFFQFRLLAGDLSDTSLFLTSLGAAFFVPVLLRKTRNASSLQGVMVLALLPWAARFLLALPRVFISGTGVFWDSLLLGLDRNNFVSLLPYYWTALSSFFCLSSRRFLRGDLIAQGALLLVVFLVTRTANIEAYRLPALILGCFGAIVFFQLLAFVFSADPEYRTGKIEQARAALMMFVLVFAGACLLIRPFEEKAVDQSGGLLQPKLFSFDFSQFIKLESEISMNTDLVLIVRKEGDSDHILLRRFILSAYNPKRGFYMDENRDETEHPARLPLGTWKSSALPSLREDAPLRTVDQEYYLVNFDSQALIALHQPEEVIPFRTWDASSFNSAYAVKSRVNEVLPFELIDAVRGIPGEENSGMDSESYRYYTDYGNDPRIAAKAEEFTGGLQDYGEKVQMIYDALKYGEYRYSLKPGIAPDGDQLGYFLFDAKKGYCSYFAFAMTLLLRSQGIPARVAAGFFIDPDTGAFDYYPVRQDMAHAWVEVWFPGYGWVEYDPTSFNLSPGEDFVFSPGISRSQFERLMEEILKNRSNLEARTGGDEDSSFEALGRQAAFLVRRSWPWLLAGTLILLILSLRAGHLFALLLVRPARKKTLRLWAHTGRRLALAGLGPRQAETESEWAKRLDAAFQFNLYEMYLVSSAARFAPQFEAVSYTGYKGLYRLFCARYAQAVFPFRRFLAWIVPPLALLLPPRQNNGNDDTGGGNGKGAANNGAANNGSVNDNTNSSRRPRGGKGAGFLLVIMLCLLFSRSAPGYSQEGIDEREKLYMEAMTAQDRENWERALELLMDGVERYPGDLRFSWALGSLYFSRELYSLAWDQFRKAEAIAGDDPELLFQLSRTAALLNRNADSASYLERILFHEPRDYRSIGDLGWMYYKLHRLAEGEDLLLQALEFFGPDRNFSMTLGTLYSDMFRYDDAKARYLEAVAEAEAMGDIIFSAVANYNLSILESRFYKYAEAAAATSASLASADRPSGHLAQGELYLRQLDFGRAFAEYENAYEREKSPLAKLSLAQAYQVAGRLDEARLYAEDCLATKDHSWMVNFGITPDHYKRDIHEILWNTYQGLENRERLNPCSGIREKIISLGKRIQYQFYRKVHQLLYSKYSLLSADSYAVQGQTLDALSNYYNAFRSYPRRALSYLRTGRDFEVPLIPQSLPSYELEEADLLGRSGQALAVIDSFDSGFQRDMTAEAYRSAAQHSRQRDTRRDAAERLYVLNRGALRQAGIKLPVLLRVSAENTGTFSGLNRALSRAGFEFVKQDARFELRISWNGNTLIWEIYDTQRGREAVRRSISADELAGPGVTDRDFAQRRISGRTAAALARSIANAAFRQ
ncbi:MAG: tetratricopeptide repeat protein [Spirochaetaceae bacterium]|nr:tetratricopeptide repeat protein [Spirochaetaceae bacterium]